MTRSPLAAAAALAAALLAGCADPPPAAPLPPNAFAFGILGDSPYFPTEQQPYRRALADVGRTDLAFFLHVGDLWGFGCADELYRQRLAELNAIPHAVIYTPGDNEWTDCHKESEGGYDPLERLALLRRTFFTRPEQSLGRTPIALESQGGEFPENARWRKGGFVFATVHMVGSVNGMKEYGGRPSAADAESARRMQAGIAWMRAAFDTARATGAQGVVIAFHAEIGLVNQYESREGFEPFIAALQHESATFPGQVIAIHGDSHQMRVDHPRMIAGDSTRFTRIETFGSPRVGWVRVVIDSVAGKIVTVEPRSFRRWF